MRRRRWPRPSAACTEHTITTALYFATYQLWCSRRAWSKATVHIRHVSWQCMAIVVARQETTSHSRHTLARPRSRSTMPQSTVHLHVGCTYRTARCVHPHARVSRWRGMRAKCLDSETAWRRCDWRFRQIATSFNLLEIRHHPSHLSFLLRDMARVQDKRES